MDYLEKYLGHFGDLLSGVPSIYYLWKKSQPFVKEGDEIKIKKIENLIFLLHNSIVSPKTRLGQDVKFAYGGIGTVIHQYAQIGNGVAIGQGVTIGGSPGKVGIDKNGKNFSVPIISDDAYIAAGCRILGGVKIGKFSIVGANSVVMSDVDEFSIYAGQPAEKIKEITIENCLKYRTFFHRYKNSEKSDYISFFAKNKNI